jgi:hypothetical protein
MNTLKSTKAREVGFEDIEVQHLLEGRLPVKQANRVLGVAESKAKYGKEVL